MKSRVEKAILIAALALLAGLVIYAALHRKVNPILIGHRAAGFVPPEYKFPEAGSSTFQVNPLFPRYGHAVRPGGISALEMDANWHSEILTHAMRGYVSYRGDDGKIYWTKKMVTIRAGEEVLTDGTRYIRARCGNEISFVPAKPTLTPEPTDLDTPEPNFAPPELPPLTMGELMPPVELIPPENVIVPQTVAEETPAPFWAPLGIYPGPFFPGVLISVTPTPEPGTVTLMSLGVLGLVIARKRR